ncbi:hypothetical protein DEO23_04770 [Brachybacterium endophyticum]|uniref:Uncharacterized protein n=2 Tax=Brachybacterium endophyticum TaxID=2182385 RepID=A0A2U2RKA0_9MICO|nr:hypothetical protein DEO23_04770 [Brachybacterium endophyticum]
MHPGSAPPLQDLDPPRRLPPTDPAAVLPEEYLVDSRRALLRTLVRACWAPALILWGLWLCLVVLYVLGAAPTYWALSLLAALGSPHALRQAMVVTGFSSGGLLLAVIAVPLLATALSLLLLSLSAALVGRVRPREHLSETSFQRSVAQRAALPLIAPAHGTIALLVLAVICRAPLHWRALSAGALSMLAIGIGLTLLAGLALRRWYSAPRVLHCPAPAALETAAMIGPHEERPGAAHRLLAQDRRHLPPADDDLGPGAGLRALTVTGRAWMRFVVPAGLALAWLVFALTDVVVLFGRIAETSAWQQSSPSALPWQLLAVAVPLGGITVCALAIAPLVALRLARPHRRRVTDQRTYRSWSDRVQVNPWEGAVATWTGTLHAGIALTAVIVLGLALGLGGVLTAVGWVWLVLDVLVLVPLIGLAGTWAMRHHLRYVIYGPAGRYMRRRTPTALVAPLLGTREERAQDPVVIAEIRRRREATASEHDLRPLVAAPDAGVPGVPSGSDAGTGAGRQATGDPLALPDFGAQGGPSAGSARQRGSGHAVPTSTTELREP